MIDFTAAYRSAEPFLVKPFDASAIQYDKFASKVTKVLSALAAGAVVAIDSPWGSGKTYFARNYVEVLRDSGWKTAYVDAFEFDYVADPFVFLASAIHGQLVEPGAKRSFMKAAVGVGRAILPAAAKAVVRVSTMGALDVDKIEDAVADAAGSAAEKFIATRIQDFDKERESFGRFNDKLAEIANAAGETSGKPLLIFIDELDRCRPDFAVRTLERIKHLFNVPGVIFVLLLHKAQLEHAVRALYGEIDADAYLRKFIHFTIPLPRSTGTRGGLPEVAAYATYLGKKLSVGENQNALNQFTMAMARTAPAFELSLRDVERAFTNFVMWVPFPSVVALLVHVYACFESFRLAGGDSLYASVARREGDALARAKAIVVRASRRGLPGQYVTMLNDIVEAHIDTRASEDAQKRWTELWQGTPDIDLQDIFTWLQQTG